MKTLFIQPEARLGDKIAAEVIIRRYKEELSDYIILMEFAPDFVAGLPVGFMVHNTIWPCLSTDEIRTRCADEDVEKIIVLHANPPQYSLEYFGRYQTSPDGKCWGRLVGPQSNPYGGPGLPKHTYFLHVFSGLVLAKEAGYRYSLDVEPIDPLPDSSRLKIAYHRRDVPWQTERNIPSAVHSETIEGLEELGDVWEIEGPFDDVKELAAKIKGCDLFVGCESGPIHVAAAVGTPSIGAHFLPANYESRPLFSGSGIILERSDENFNSAIEIVGWAREISKNGL